MVIPVILISTHVAEKCMHDCLETTADYPDAPRPAVGAVVFKDNHVLLVKRGNAPARGVWAIPGGRVRLGESLQAAAEREILEETGVVIRAGDPVFVFDVIERDDTGTVRFHYVIVDLSADYLSGDPLAGDDADAARWISQPQLAEITVNPTTRRLLSETFGFGEPPRGVDEKCDARAK
jgi:8-oxo-dGTP diphosphatase